ncbi:Fungal specific transcription factor domain-containing protein 29 [Elsinoe fawcettii]|nr:Fungal specific transcription factor domain-containing protein 29 [Elsinoe fawcettii]
MVLSGHEAGNGSKTRAWLYSGMAVRLAFDLALHLDVSSQAAAGILSPAEVDLRRRVFWSICTADQALGFQLGRPTRISMEDVTVAQPGWQGKPADAASLVEGTDARAGVMTTLDVGEFVQQQRVMLCEIMASCGYILYSTSKYSKDALQKLNAGIVAQLCEWKVKLPPSLQIGHSASATYVPSVMLLQ